MAKLRKYLDKGAKAIAKAVGGADLVDYAGSKIAKMRAKGAAKKYVEDKTSGRKALISAAKVAASIAPAGAGLKVARVVKAAKAAKPTSTFKMGKKVVKVFDSAKVKRPKGVTINKGNKWSAWGE